MRKSYRDYAEGEIVAITPGEEALTWNVFRKGKEGEIPPAELAREWTDEMSAWRRAFYGEDK